MNNYKYHRLENGFIRLVTLLPGEHYERIKIAIDTAELRLACDTRRSLSPRVTAESL
jgi:hypothetical protein